MKIGRFHKQAVNLENTLQAAHWEVSAHFIGAGIRSDVDARRKRQHTALVFVCVFHSLLRPVGM